MFKSPSPQRLIGLTGGIATGKSTVADYLIEHYPLALLDADIYARQAVAKGSDILKAIAKRYGKGILEKNGELDRAALGKIIFNQPKEKQWLEEQIHPYVRDCFLFNLNQLPTLPTVLLVIPLLFEARLTALTTEIWVVTCTPEQQLARLKQRNNLTAAEALARINSQMPLAEKVAQADVVLDNSGSREDLQTQIDQAWAG